MLFENEPTQDQSVIFSMTKRQASLLVAAGFFIVFITFISGYFWGKSNAISQFCMSVEQSTFADRIYTSMCELSESEAPTTQDTVTQNSESPADIATAVDAESELEPEIIDQVESIDPNAEPQIVKHDVQINAEPVHHGQLAGYGTMAQAQKFAQKLCKKGIPAKVETKTSKSSKGKTRSWYQVITQDYTDKAELESVVARITKEEKLRGVRIVRSEKDTLS